MNDDQMLRVLDSRISASLADIMPEVNARISRLEALVKILSKRISLTEAKLEKEPTTCGQNRTE